MGRHDTARFFRTVGRSPYRVLEHHPTALLLVCHSDELVCFANRRAEAVLEKPRNELLGEELSTILGVNSQSFMVNGTAREVRLPSGRVLGCRAASLELDDDDEIPTIAIVFQDITEVIALREERDRLARIAAVGSVLPAIMHELKNPLAAISTITELVLEELAEIPEAQAGVLGEIIRQLQLCKTEQHRMKIILEGAASYGRPLSSASFGAVDHACREAVEILKPQAAEAGVILRQDVRDMPLLPIDIPVLRGIIFNLLVNALHATPRGGVFVFTGVSRSRF